MRSKAVRINQSYIDVANLHALRRQLFWSDWSADGGRIRSSTLLGEHIRTLVDRNLVQPTSLVIDYTASR